MTRIASQIRNMFGYGRSARLVPTPNGSSNASLRVLVVGAGVAGISVARGLLRDGHDVTVFEQRPDVQAGGGAVTIWSNGETVLRQLGVEMDGAGQLLSTRAGRDIHGSSARHSRRDRDGGSAGRTCSDGSTSGPA